MHDAPYVMGGATWMPVYSGPLLRFGGIDTVLPFTDGEDGHKKRMAGLSPVEEGTVLAIPEPAPKKKRTAKTPTAAEALAFMFVLCAVAEGTPVGSAREQLVQAIAQRPDLLSVVRRKLR